MGRKRLCRFARMTEAYVIGCIARNINRKQNRSYRLKHQEECRNENKFDSFSMCYRYNSDWQRLLSSPLSISSYSFFHLFICRGTCFIVPLVEQKCALPLRTPSFAYRHTSFSILRCHQFLCREKKFLYILNAKWFFYKKDAPQRCEIFIRNMSRLAVSHDENCMKNILFPFYYRIDLPFKYFWKIFRRFYYILRL